MNILKNSSIKTKKDLYAFYQDQMARRTIGTEIQCIVEEKRATFAKKHQMSNERVRLLSLKEVVMFVARNDAPAGYILNEEMQRRVDEYKRIYALKK